MSEGGYSREGDDLVRLLDRYSMTPPVIVGDGELAKKSAYERYLEIEGLQHLIYQHILKGEANGL